MNPRLRRFFKGLALTLAWLVGLFLVMQIIPYGRTHRNPPIVKEPAWDSPRTRALAVRACFDCHSNETHWPWYANVAPLSWVVEFDVGAAREVTNFSEWNLPFPLAPYSGLSVKTGNMPPFKWQIAHPEGDPDAGGDGRARQRARRDARRIRRKSPSPP